MAALEIGSRIRKLRLQQRRTQQEIADACGFTKSLISKIETNKVMPPVATLVKIANSLGTNISALIEANENGVSAKTSAADVKENLVKTAQGYWIHPFAMGFHKKRMQPFLFVVKKGEVEEHHLAHEGEEFLYVLEGSVQVQVGSEEHTLEAGDALYFDAACVHQVIPISDEATYLDIFV